MNFDAKGSAVNASSVDDMAPADLVERERELEELLGALASACTGAGRLVVISGGAGVGKSRLLDVAADQARVSGMDVLAGRGLEFERDFPFGVALQLLEPPLAAADPARRAGLLAGAAAAAALFEGSEVTGLADGVDHSYAFVHGLRRLAGNLIAPPGGTQARPVLVAVDDAQWADVMSLRFLIRLAADLKTLPAAILVATRDSDHDANASFLRRLAASADHELRLGRLSPQAVAAVVCAAYAGAAPEFWQACARASGGNPFYLHEIVKAAQADGIPATARGAAEIAGLVPESVLRSVLLRLAQVPGAGLALASAVAILGDAAPLAQAAELAGLDDEKAERAADALARSRILIPGEPLAFTHPLIAAAIRDDLPALARSRAHRRAARLLAAQGSPAEVVAAHLLACRPADDADAASILGEAAEHAAVRGEYDAARRFLERALAERRSAGPQADLRLQLALAQAAVGVPDAPARLTGALEFVRDRHSRAQALQALGRLQFARSDFPAAAEAISRALSQLGQADPLARELLIDQMAIAALQPDLCPEAATRLAALTDDARCGRLPGEAALLAQLASSMVFSGESAGRVREVACAAVRGLSGDTFYGITTGSVVLALIHIDELDLAGAPVEATMERARRAGSLIGTGFASHWRAMLHYHRGALDQAIAAAGDTVEVCRAGWDLCLPWVVSLLVRAHIDRGDLRAAAETLRLCEGTTETGPSRRPAAGGTRAPRAGPRTAGRSPCQAGGRRSPDRPAHDAPLALGRRAGRGAARPAGARGRSGRRRAGPGPPDRRPPHSRRRPPRRGPDHRGPTGTGTADRGRRRAGELTGRSGTRPRPDRPRRHLPAGRSVRGRPPDPPSRLPGRAGTRCGPARVARPQGTPRRRRPAALPPPPRRPGRADADRAAGRPASCRRSWHS
ncbi:MAG TPA: AAA family ATPase [Streptosporangiaceae bacterium]|nr:AAA family ATPase [Streptosporangiaceae bacterium]